MKATIREGLYCECSNILERELSLVTGKPDVLYCRHHDCAHYLVKYIVPTIELEAASQERQEGQQ